MPIPYFPSSKRRPHLWRIRAEGYRDLLLSKRWTMCGAYAAKNIRRRTVMVTIVEEHDDYYLCRFQLKDDFWADITTEFREREASQLQSSFKVVQGIATETKDSNAMDSELTEGDEAIGCGFGWMVGTSSDMERAWANIADYLDDEGEILADRILQRKATGLLLDRDRHERLSLQVENCLEKLRSAVPDTEYIDPVLDYEAGVLWVDLYPEDFNTIIGEAYKNSNGDPRFGNPDFNALADRLELWRADSSSEEGLVLRVRAYFSVTHAIAALEQLPGVMSAGVYDEGMEDEPDIAMAPAGTDAYAVVVRGAYNKRTFKRTSRRYRFFLVSDAGVTQMSAQEASRSQSFRDAVVDRPWRRRLRWPGQCARSWNTNAGRR